MPAMANPMATCETSTSRPMARWSNTEVTNTVMAYAATASISAPNK